MRKYLKDVVIIFMIILVVGLSNFVFAITRANATDSNDYDFTDELTENRTGIGFKWVASTKTLTITGIKNNNAILKMPDCATIDIQGSNQNYIKGISGVGELTIKGNDVASLSIKSLWNHHSTLYTGLYAETLNIDSGNVSMEVSDLVSITNRYYYGVHSRYININGGKIDINVSGSGFTVAGISTNYMVMNGGKLNVNAYSYGIMKAYSQTQNGVIINGGEIYINSEASRPIEDVSLPCEINGGSISFIGGNTETGGSYGAFSKVPSIDAEKEWIISYKRKGKDLDGLTTIPIEDIYSFYNSQVLRIVDKRTTLLPVYYTGSIKYTAAFEMLDLINENRSQDNKLIMDETLMNNALTRAEEIALYYSNIRPDGSENTTLNGKNANNYREIMAICELHGEEEENHAISEFWNKLVTLYGSDFSDVGNKNIGISCVLNHGIQYWIILLDDDNNSNEVEEKQNEEKSVKIEIYPDYLNLSAELYEFYEYYDGSRHIGEVDNGNTKKIYIVNNRKIASDNYQLYIDASTFEWKSLNTDIATVDDNGNVTGVNGGKTSIEAKLGDISIVTDITVTIPLESISLDYEEYHINMFKTKTFSVNFYPENSKSSKNVFWRVEGSSNIFIDGNGMIQGYEAGEGMVIAECDGKKATCKVIVHPEVCTEESIYQLAEGKTKKINIINYLGDKDLSTEVEWSVDNEEIAQVNSEGVITALKMGTTSIMGKIDDDNIVSCLVEVTAPEVLLEGVYFMKYDNMYSLNDIENNMGLVAFPVAMSPSNQNTLEKIEYFSLDENICNVDKNNGSILSGHQGSTQIRVVATDKYGNTFTDTCDIRMYVPIESISIKNKDLINKSLIKGEEIQLEYEIYPSDADLFYPVRWAVNNENIMSIDENGKLTAISGNVDENGVAHGNTGSVYVGTQDISGNSIIDTLTDVSVVVPVEKIEVVPDEYTIRTTMSIDINENIKFEPFDTTERTKFFETSDSNVATCDGGILTPWNRGRAVIKVKMRR